MSDVASHSDAGSHGDVASLTADDLKTQISQLGLTQHQVATAWGVSRETVSRWVRGRLAIPAWVEYAVGLRSIYEHHARLSFAPAQKLVEALKPPSANETKEMMKRAFTGVLEGRKNFADDAAVLREVAKSAKADDRPFRYMGGRKVYL